MAKINQQIFKSLYQPPQDSHKGQNGKLTIIGGSKLFHGASLWALKTASRLVDMVFYSTVKENEELTQKLKKELYDFICIPRTKLKEYIEQSDAVLIGPGLVRGDKEETGTNESGQETKKLVKDLIFSFPKKKWILDAGALQVLEPDWLKQLDQVIITPHQKEFKNLFIINKKNSSLISEKLVQEKAKQYNCIIILKSKTDIVCNQDKCLINTTGNQGMTKGGTGDVLAGLIAGLACKNDLFLAAQAGIYLNGLAGDELAKKTGPYFNASDLCDQIPITLNKLLKKEIK